MLEIANVEVMGLENSMARCRMPRQTGKPDLEEMRWGSAKRARSLGKTKAGTGHCTYLKGIIVQFDLRFPVYMDSHILRYHWMDVISSQSRMANIARFDIEECFNEWVEPDAIERVKRLHEEYTQNKSKENFMRLVSNLPQGFEYWMSMTTNYLQLKTVHSQRRRHKLPEWRKFCEWCETLPRFRELVLGEYDD